MKTLYVVEIIRYGDPKLGVHLFGVFSNLKGLHERMVEYNSYRGGKYPSYRITEMFVNTEMPFTGQSVIKSVEGVDI